MTESSHPRTLPDLFAHMFGSITLSWFTTDLSPEPDWSAPDADSSGWCDLGGPAARDHVLALAAGLIDAGVKPGDRVALMLSNRPEHWLADLAVLHAGAVPSTFYPTLPVNQVRAQAAHAQISTAIIEGPAQLRQWSQALDLPGLRRMIVLDSSASLDNADIVWQTYSETLRRGAVLLSSCPNAVIDRVERTEPDDPALIIFTSGTTGSPNAVLLTHRNLIAAASGVEAGCKPMVPFRSVSYLPTAHIVDRTANMYLVLLLGGHVAFSPTDAALGRVMARFRPTAFVGVPRVWEKLLNNLERLRTDLPDEDPLALAGLDRIALAVTAGAPLPPDIADRIDGFGIDLVDMWGLTEAGGLTSATPAIERRGGTVGRALPELDVRVAADGELLVRGPQISAGYLQIDGSVTPITDSHGWLATGDLGTIDTEGFIRITDRKKEIIVTSGGKNVSPVALESLLTQSRLVDQALAFGDGRPYLVALLTLDSESARSWLREHHGLDAQTMGPRELSEHPLIRQQVADDVDRANGALARVEQIKYWTLLSEPWSVEQGTVTPSLKLRRNAVHRLHCGELDAMYQHSQDLPGLDLSRLRPFLDMQCPGLVTGPLSARLIDGGRSNLTYLVSDARSQLVVRRPPLGHVLPTAHDMAREHRILEALYPTAIPVPRPYTICPDESVLGAPFYVMEFRAGTPYRSDAQLSEIGAARTRVIMDNVVDLLADLHAINPESVGLGDFGRPEGFLARQLRRWQAQLESSRSRDVSALDALGRRLAESIPKSGPAAVVHGDYRLDNVLVAENDCLSAVLDWEMSTLGDPLTDLALLIAYGRSATVDLGVGVGTAPGYPSDSEIIERYAKRTCRDVTVLPWYLGFAFFKLAVIAEGIHYRFSQGQTVGDGFETSGAAVEPFIDLARNALEEQ